ncbi:hypothetical protein [Alteromonas gilva]|uniref:Uncharacterized protein n=1 Tax=Alteromonas gilva TaxID=2987522 RepID=A0ABT5L8R6_9ALTE|nr:hypothetical protein [Alteromonas gilva]MDC8832929.1 hypothetical protein [Alteromonas gilva]
MNYILTMFQGSKIVYDTKVIGSYDFVHKVQSNCAPGVCAWAVSYAYFEGRFEDYPNPYPVGSEEHAHFETGKHPERKLMEECRI